MAPERKEGHWGPQQCEPEPWVAGGVGDIDAAWPQLRRGTGSRMGVREVGTSLERRQ